MQNVLLLFVLNYELIIVCNPPETFLFLFLFYIIRRTFLVSRKTICLVNKSGLVLSSNWSIWGEKTGGFVVKECCSLGENENWIKFADHVSLTCSDWRGGLNNMNMSTAAFCVCIIQRGMQLFSRAVYMLFLTSLSLIFPELWNANSLVL